MKNLRNILALAVFGVSTVALAQATIDWNKLGTPQQARQYISKLNNKELQEAYANLDQARFFRGSPGLSLRKENVRKELQEELRARNLPVQTQVISSQEQRPLLGREQGGSSLATKKGTLRNLESLRK